MVNFMMREGIIFLFLFIIVFAFSIFIFNGRYIYTQIKYNFLGPVPIVPDKLIIDIQEENPVWTKDESYQVPQEIIIPLLGIEAPIIWPEDTSESALQRALEKGVAIWPNSALLNDKGTMIILGHSSAYPWYKGDYGSIFSLLNKLNVGDEILILSPEKKYIYRIVEKEIQLPNNLSIQEQNSDSILYLLSCWPISTNWKRIAVKAIAIDKD